MKIIGANITGSFILNGQNITNTLQSSSVWSGSVASSITSINSTTSSLNTFTGSASDRLSSIELTTGSLNSASGSAITRLGSLEAKTGSYSTTGSNTFVGNQTFSGSLIPSVDIAYDLGSPTNRWKDLHLSGSTIYLGDVILSATSGGFEIRNSSGSYHNIVGSASYASTAVSSSLASQAVSSSYAINALTASYLSNYIPPFPYTGSAAISGSLTVTGNITAQTLVVQTITSSVDFVTGSSKFGSLSSNNHQFTGSVSITGSLSATSLTGSIAYSNLTGVPTLVSGSSQISYTSLSSIPAGIVSGSSQITYSSISSIPAGIVSSSAQVTGIGNSQLTNSSFYVGTTSISLGRGSASQTLNGVSIDGNAATATAAQNSSFQTQPNSTWSAKIQLGGNGDPGSNSALAVVQATDGNLHLDCGTGKSTYLNYYRNGTIYLNGSSYYISSNGANYNGNSATTSQRTFSYVRTDGINRGSYGIISISGNNNGYGGIDFTDQNMTLMINASATGFYYTNNTWRVYWDGSGNQNNTGDVTAYASDKRLKTNITNIPNSLDKIRSINGVTYDWKLDECAKWNFNPQKHDVGVIAQEIQEICPEAVTFAPFDRDPTDGSKSKSGENYLTVKYEKLVPLLIEAIKEQQSQIEELKAKLG